MKTLIKNIKEIIGITDSITDETIKKGKELNKLHKIEDGWIIIENNIINGFTWCR